MGWPRAFPLSLRHARIGVCASFAAGQWLLTRQLRCLYMVVPRTLCGFQYCRCCCRCRCRCPPVLPVARTPMRDPCKCLTRTAIIPHVLPGSYPVSHTSTHKPQKRPRFVESTSGTAPERASTRHSWSAGRIRGWLSAPPPWPLGAASECWRLGSGDHGFRASVRRRAVAGGFKTATGEFLPAGVPAIQRRELPAQVLPCPRQHLTRSLATRSKSAHQATSGEWRAMDMTTTMS